MKLECNVQRKISKKTGNPYYSITITFPNGYKKVILPEYSESFIIDTVYKEG